MAPPRSFPTRSCGPASGTYPGGATPFSGLVADTAGNLYGTTQAGGTYGQGVAFELSPSANGKWTETVLHAFGSYSGDALEPLSGLILDSAGNLYGTTIGGGSGQGGTVFELSPGTNGRWTEKLLYQFVSGTTGAWFPRTGLTMDPQGNQVQRFDKPQPPARAIVQGLSPD